VARRQANQLDTPIVEKGVAADEKRVRPLACEGCEGRIVSNPSGKAAQLEAQRKRQRNALHGLAG